MATQAPTTPAKKKPKVETPKQPPEDSIWTRYSPHGEIQLSSAGSFAVHALGIGLFIILGLFVYKSKDDKASLPVEVVSISGGGRGAGRGIGDGLGDGSGTEDGRDKGDGSVIEGPKDDGPLRLDDEKLKVLPSNFTEDPAAKRAMEKGNPNARAFTEMSESARNKLRSGLNPGGNGGTGTGGTQGGNDGDGTGGVKGRPLNEREKRLFRWRLVFDRASPASYLSQLESLGAFIGVPVEYDQRKKEWIYKSVRKLRAPSKLENEDPTSLGLLRWNNSDPNWAVATMRELQLDVAPNHFIVYFPRQLEDDFAAAELAYLKRKNLKLEQIDETFFHLQAKGNKLVPIIRDDDPPHTK